MKVQSLLTIVISASSLMLGLTAQSAAHMSNAGTATPTPKTAVTPTLRAATATSAIKPAVVTATAKAAIAQATKEARASIATSTAEARAEIIALYAEYLPANFKVLMSYADNHIGEKVIFSGKVFNIVPGSSDQFQLFPTGLLDGVLVQTSDDLNELYENDVVTVYGVVAGQTCFKNNQGTEVCQPQIAKAFYVKGQKPEMKAGLATAQAVVVQATKDARFVQATAQAEIRATVQAVKTEYSTIATRELKTYPDRHTGEKVHVTGRVFNIPTGGGVVQMYFPGTYDPLYVEMADTFSDIFANDSITVYGVVGGTKCFKNAAGGEVCHPLIQDAFYTKP